MATSLYYAKRRGYHPKFIGWGEEAVSWLKRQGVSNPKETSIYIDPSGFVSYKGKHVREKDGTLVPYGTAPLTRQGRATAELEASAANKRLTGIIGQSRTVSSRKELQRQERDIDKAQSGLTRAQQIIRARQERERAAREAVQTRTIAAPAPRPVLQPLSPKPPVTVTTTNVEPPVATTATPRPTTSPTAATPSARRFVRFQGVATEQGGVTILFLKP